MKYYNRGGEAITCDEWARLVNGENYRRVSFDLIGDPPANVSTVWIGIDYDFTGPGPPLIFETMIFGVDDDSDPLRCSTGAEARRNHDETVAAIRGGRMPEWAGWDE